ncbi:MAG TPA: alpha/beta hydrolase [Acidimicrobiales bacterium]|nr:alpha/beta hydrolase [Acidimicrobiales bacterium]
MGDSTVGDRSPGDSSPGDSSPGDRAFGDGAAGSYASTANYRLELNGSHEGAVVLLHGLGGELSQLWGLTPGEVGGRPAPILAADAREHGSTFTADMGPLSFDAMAQDATSLADSLQLGPKLVLVGVSMGAATAMAVAIRDPGRVHALVIVRPAWLNQPLPNNLRAFPEVAKLLRGVGAERGRAIFQESALYREIEAISPSGAASLLGQFDQPGAVARARRLEEMPSSVPYQGPEPIQSLSVPVLVIGAPSDPVHPIGYAEELASLIPGSRLAVLASRDLSPERNRADLETAVTRFLADLAPMSGGHR